MEHFVYLDPKSKEEEKFFNHTKSMLLRVKKNKNTPSSLVNKGDKLYFFNNFSNCHINSKAEVVSVIDIEKNDELNLIDLVENYQAKLQLSIEQFDSILNNNYIVLIELNFKRINSLKIKAEMLNNCNWFTTDKIDRFISN